MSLLSHFRVDQGLPANVGAGTPIRNRRQHGLFSSSPFHTPSGSDHHPQWGSQLPPQYTPSHSSRRPRSPLGDDMERQHSAKRTRQFATDVCREYQLKDGALNNFAWEMLITVFAKLLAIERASQRDELTAYVHGKQFKEIMQDRIRLCLLSPNLTGYLAELPENIWAFMKRNLDMFKIPPKALEDPELSVFIDSLVKDLLTKQRSTIKTKIMTSIDSKMHVSHLAKSLAPSGYYEVTTGQWARFAFLRASLETFTELVNESMKEKVTLMAKGNKPASVAGDDAEMDHSSDEEVPEVRQEKPRSWNMTDFWAYVDNLLTEIWGNLEDTQLTIEQRKKKIDEFFTSCLQCDLKKYPTTKRNAGIPAVNQVTSELHRNIYEQLMW